jgi:hypothetical protein
MRWGQQPPVSYRDGDSGHSGMLGWLRSKHKTTTDPLVAAPLRNGHRCYSGEQFRDGVLRPKHNHDIPMLRGCNKQVGRFSGSPWCFLDGRICQLKAEVSPGTWIPAMAVERERPDSRRWRPPHIDSSFLEVLGVEAELRGYPAVLWVTSIGGEGARPELGFRSTTDMDGLRKTGEPRVRFRLRYNFL